LHLLGQRNTFLAGGRLEASSKFTVYKLLCGTHPLPDPAAPEPEPEPEVRCSTAVNV
jgi:hypothetical protein